MRYSHLTPSGIVWMSPIVFANAAPLQGTRGCAEMDRRWPAMLRKLKSLRKRGRRSIRIVDADCGAGELLMLAARRARELGFLAIEGRGIDSDPQLIASARRNAARKSDPAIGLVFEAGDPCEAMQEEAAFPADLLLCPAKAREERAIAAIARAAGRTVLWEPTEPTEGARS